MIDTAHRAGYLALGEGKHLIAKVALDPTTRHSERAAHELQNLLIESQVEAASLDLIAVGLGPGSYTGVRVGIALAKGLNLALGVPVLGYCSLRAYRGGMPAFDARAGGVYLLDKQGPVRISLADLVKVHGPIVSPDAKEITGRLSEKGPTVTFAQPELEPLLRELIEEGKGSADGRVEPFYIRAGRVELANIEQER